MATESAHRPVESAVVVGAGMVGLATAWHLQEHGVEVTVLERSGVAAGSSWGNAGWISPGLCVPLSDPSVLNYGLKSLLDPDSPLYVPFKPDPSLARFLLGFARRCTPGQWKRTMATFVPLNQRAIGAYDTLERGGVQATSHEAPIVAAFKNPDDAAGLEREFDMIRGAGLDLETEETSPDVLRRTVPIISEHVQRAVSIRGQRFINPGDYAQAVADAVTARGGRVITGANVRAFQHVREGVRVDLTAGEPFTADVVVVATGAWLPELTAGFGVKVPVRAGRGYSFKLPITDPAARPVAHPIYFPYERIACTPIDDGLRVGGTMEFCDTDDPLHVGRADAIARSGRDLLTGVDWEARDDLWCGNRPVPLDGLPLVGATRVPGVYVNGGHGMWGITLGPLSGELLAEQIVTGRVADELRPLDPLR